MRRSGPQRDSAARKQFHYSVLLMIATYAALLVLFASYVTTDAGG